MARLEVDNGQLVVRLSRLERLGALRFDDIRVPTTAIRKIRASASPWREIRGLRAPGTGIPGLITLCTTRGRFGRDFNAVYAGRGVVVVELEGADWQRLVISVDDPELVARQLTS